MMKITKDMSILDVVEQYPNTGDVFLSYDINWKNERVAACENVEQGCIFKGVDVNKVLDDLNKAVDK